MAPLQDAYTVGSYPNIVASRHVSVEPPRLSAYKADYHAYLAALDVYSRLVNQMRDTNLSRKEASKQKQKLQKAEAPYRRKARAVVANTTTSRLEVLPERLGQNWKKAIDDDFGKLPERIQTTSVRKKRSKRSKASRQRRAVRKVVSAADAQITVEKKNVVLAKLQSQAVKHVKSYAQVVQADLPSVINDGGWTLVPARHRAPRTRLFG